MTSRPNRRTADEVSTLEKLQAYSETYLDYSKRWGRSMVTVGERVICGDPALDLSFRTAESRMNGLLEKYFTEITSRAFSSAVEGVELEVVEVPGIPIKHTQETYDYDGA